MSTKNQQAQFDWEPYAEDKWRCYHKGMHLQACVDGRWWVLTKDGDICTNSEMQTKGDDLQSAMHRAQRAAIILAGA